MTRGALLVLLVLGAPGCLVPAGRLDAAVARADAEAAGRAGADREVARVNGELQRATRALRERESRVGEQERQLAEQGLALEQARLAREDAERLLEQLRGELGFAGERLRGSLATLRAQEARLAELEEALTRLAPLPEASLARGAGSAEGFHGGDRATAVHDQLLAGHEGRPREGDDGLGDVARLPQAP